MDFSVYPKVELHLHLDCSLSYNVVHTLDPSITQEAYRRDFIAPARCTNLADFLTRTPHSIALMQTEEQLRLVVFDVFEQLQRDHLLYAEIRFAPLLRTDRGLAPEQVIEIVEAATSHACASTDIEARLILCTLRHFSAAQSLQTARLVEQFRGTRVAALDLAGDEAGFPIAPHIAAYQYAADRNLPRTAHAGEASGPQSVWETLRSLHPARIGHGVRSIEDPALIEHLRQERVHLEVCPTSNLQTNIYETFPDHPINRLYELGIPVSVNTDARTITDITLTREYEKLHQFFAWDKQHFLRCTTNGPTGDCGGTQATFLLSKSTDGGKTWSTLVTIATVTLVPDPRACCFFGQLPNTAERVSDIPVIGIDNSGGTHAGNLYAAFYTWTGSFMVVEVATSTNGGSTWGTSVRVSGSLNDEFFPWLSVSSGGLVGVTWLDRRNDPTNLSYEAFAAVSGDGGATFPNLQIAAVASNPNNDGFGGGFMGDYTGNVWNTTGTTLYASWMDSRNRFNMQDEVGGRLGTGSVTT